MILKPIFFHFKFLIQDFLLNMVFIILKIYQHVDNIHFEKTLSQNFKIGLSFIFMSKNEKIFVIFL